MKPKPLEKIQNEIKIIDMLEKEAIKIQKSKLWCHVHKLRETIKLWAQVSVSGSFTLTLLIILVSVSEYKDALGIKPEWWPAVFTVGFFVSLLFLGRGIVKLIFIYRNNDVINEDQLIESLFSERNDQD